MIVVDASVLVEILLQTPLAPGIEHRLFDAGVTLHVPYLIDIEVAHAVRRYAIGGQIDSDRGRLALELLGGLPLDRYPHRVLLTRIWDLRHNLTAYDAAYVALAEALAAPLITRDARLVAASGHHAQIELI